MQFLRRRRHDNPPRLVRGWIRSDASKGASRKQPNPSQRISKPPQDVSGARSPGNSGYADA
jgi:hypothetical protein